MAAQTFSQQRTRENAELFEDFLGGLGALGGKFKKTAFLRKPWLKQLAAL